VAQAALIDLARELKSRSPGDHEFVSSRATGSARDRFAEASVGLIYLL
jgi:hypothetical protein